MYNTKKAIAKRVEVKNQTPRLSVAEPYKFIPKGTKLNSKGGKK